MYSNPNRSHFLLTYHTLRLFKLMTFCILFPLRIYLFSSINKTFDYIGLLIFQQCVHCRDRANLNFQKNYLLMHV